MRKNQDHEDALNRELERRFQNKTEPLSKGLEKAIEDTKREIDEAFRNRPKVPVTPKLTLSA